jgi:hypothetical protein
MRRATFLARQALNCRELQQPARGGCQMPVRVRRSTLGLALATAAALVLAGCETYSRPNRDLPTFKATGLDGTDWSREALAGRPWVINLWVPG